MSQPPPGAVPLLHPTSNMSSLGNSAHFPPRYSVETYESFSNTMRRNLSSGTWFQHPHASTPSMCRKQPFSAEVPLHSVVRLSDDSSGSRYPITDLRFLRRHRAIIRQSRALLWRRVRAGVSG